MLASVGMGGEASPDGAHSSGEHGLSEGAGLVFVGVGVASISSHLLKTPLGSTVGLSRGVGQVGVGVGVGRGAVVAGLGLEVGRVLGAALLDGAGLGESMVAPGSDLLAAGSGAGSDGGCEEGAGGREVADPSTGGVDSANLIHSTLTWRPTSSRNWGTTMTTVAATRTAPATEAPARHHTSRRIPRRSMRPRITSSPSGEGTTEFASALSARRSSSPYSSGESVMTVAPVRFGGRPCREPCGS